MNFPFLFLFCMCVRVCVCLFLLIIEIIGKDSGSNINVRNNLHQDGSTQLFGVPSLHFLFPLVVVLYEWPSQYG